MAYHVFAAGEYDPESPLTTQFFSDIIGNFAGLANGDTNHPEIINPAIVDPVAGTVYCNQRYGRTVSGSTWDKYVGWRIPRTGVYRGSMRLRRSVAGADNTSGEWYVNGSAIGSVHLGNTNSFVEFTDDISLTRGDLLQFYAICITLGPWSCRVGVSADTLIDRLVYEDEFVGGDLEVI